MNGCRPTPGGALLDVRVVPRASRDAVGDPVGNALKIRLRAPPVDGKANEALIRFLADALSVSRSGLAIVSGETSRNKRVHIGGLTPDDVLRRLRPGPPSP